MAQSIRKLIGLIAAIVLYYVIHEGAHLLAALYMGTFQEIRFYAWGLLGVQIVVDAAAMSNAQLFAGAIAGPAAALIAGYILAWRRKSILRSANKFVLAIAYYTTLVLLCVDPLYLSIIHRFVGGGDMNGIVLLGIPEIPVSIFFALLLIANLFIFFKRIYPSYKQSFSPDAQ